MKTIIATLLILSSTAQADWSVQNFEDDEMYAVSAYVKPVTPMQEPYKDVQVRLLVNCDLKKSVYYSSVNAKFQFKNGPSILPDPNKGGADTSTFTMRWGSDETYEKLFVNFKSNPKYWITTGSNGEDHFFRILLTKNDFYSVQFPWAEGLSPVFTIPLAGLSKIESTCKYSTAKVF